jgi:cyclohexyl-isocyanide hydratase
MAETLKPMHIGFLVFPDITQLDMTGPLQVLTRVPGAKVHLIWKCTEPVPSDTALIIVPTVTFADCPQLDVLCVPGGVGTGPLIEDQEVLDFLRRQAAGARWVTSVCTGALVLGAAGLLKGYEATTHWTWLEQLAPLGAKPVDRRVVIDRNRITGGGVTAGIDFGLTLAAKLAGEDAAKAIQLSLEYDPAPPFDAGSPGTAPAAIVAGIRERLKPRAQEVGAAIQRAAGRIA